MSDTCVDDLINEGCWEVVFGTFPIEIMKVYANVNGTLFFIHGNKIRNPSGVHNGVNEVGCAQLLDFVFDRGNFGGMDWTLLLVHKGHIEPCIDVVFHDGWIQPGHFSVRPGKDVTEFLEESFVGSDFFRGAGFPNMIPSTTSGLVEMLILMVGNMLAMFLSSKAYGARMGFLNQSNFP